MQAFVDFCICCFESNNFFFVSFVVSQVIQDFFLNKNKKHPREKNLNVKKNFNDCDDMMMI
jgi:hypothetical protein